jgi:hypothetical protein
MGVDDQRHAPAALPPGKVTYLLTYLTYSMQQSPSWEANRFSASQETPRILWSPKVHYRSHKCPPPVPILSQLIAVREPALYKLLTFHVPNLMSLFRCSDRTKLSMQVRDFLCGHLITR